ncbi:MAG TPA: ABC transporter ATP-binding protein/permease [Candidatus Paenibacillus intestinavium]|nr:ABC transporter ATP-binding protein/permease [Candidatus Paenibacillus intestinavium]
MIPFQYELPSSLLAREEDHPSGAKVTKLKGFGLGGAPGRAPAKAKKPDQMVTTLRRIWGYLATYRVKLIAVIIMIVLATAFSLLGPFLVGYTIDNYIIARQDGLLYILAIMGGVYGLQALVNWLQNIWMIEISQQTVYRMRLDLFHQFHRLPIPFFAKRQQGDLMSRATNDIDNISSSMNSSFIQICSSTLMLVGITIVMLFLSPVLTLLTFCVIPLMIYGMRWISGRTSRLFRVQQRNLGALNGFVEETLSGQKIIKSFSQENVVISQFQERNEKIRLSGYWAQVISGFIPKLMNGLNSLSFALIVGVGALLTLWIDTITVGIIIIFAEYARQFTRPLNDLANQWNTLLSAIAGAERVFQILDESKENIDEQSASVIDEIDGKVTFDKVSFEYETGRNTISNISFTVQPGETVAFVGPTGAGKTTLISLLSRFYEPSSGGILIDGRPIASIKRESLRAHMAFVLQDPYLFEGTILDNIRYGRLDASSAQVIEAAKLANADSFIMRLKDGYETKLKLGGAGISQGQKQLIAIARALIANPSILVLDEATSSIDTVTEIKIQEALERLMKGRTSFVIAHRLNTIRQADKIIVLQEGQLQQQGSHEELLREDGLYRKLVQGQIILEA